jgi:hypothetical protein
VGKIFGRIKAGFRAGKEARELVMGNKKTWTMIFAMGSYFLITFFVFSLLYRLFRGPANLSTIDEPTLLPTLPGIIFLLAVVLIGSFSMHYAKSFLTLKGEGSFFNSFIKSFTFSLSRLKQPLAWIFVLVGFPFLFFFFYATAPACLIAIAYVSGGFKKSLACSWFLFRKFFWEAFGFNFYLSLMSLMVCLLAGIVWLPIRSVVTLLSHMLGAVLASYVKNFAVVILSITGLGFLTAISSFFALNLYKRAAVMRPDLLQ